MSRVRLEKIELATAILKKSHDDLLSFTLLTKPDYIPSACHKKMASKLKKILTGELQKSGKKGLMIFLPPRHGKSELCSIRFPAFFLGHFPTKKIMLISYAASLSQALSRKVRSIVSNPLYPLIFRETRLSDKTGADNWETTLGGGVMAMGILGSITGHGADLVIIDDPIKNRDEAESAHIREKIWEQYREVVETRLEPQGAVILIMTRWHKDDLAGRLLEKERKRWEVLHFRALNKNGEPLWPEKWPKERLLKKREELGAYAWQALYQGTPTYKAGYLVQRENITFVDSLPEGKEYIYIGGVDTATTLKTVNDRSALCKLAVSDDGYMYVVGVFMDRVTSLGLCDFIINSHEEKPFTSINFEKNSAGILMLERLEERMRERGIIVPVKGVSVNKDKVSRLMAVEPAISNGTIRFLRGAPGVETLAEHLIDFPYGNCDDDVDAFIHAVEATRDMKFKMHWYLRFLQQQYEVDLMESLGG